MRSEESLARFLARLGSNLIVVLTGVLVALILSSLVPAFRIAGPLVFELLLPLTLAAVFVWTLASAPRGGPDRLRALLAGRNYEKAFLLACRSEQLEELDQLLQAELALPAESLRPRIRAVFGELRILHQSLHDQTNRLLDPRLRRYMQKRSSEARQGLWKLCEHLEVVASQMVRFADDHPKMKRISALLDDLAQSAGEVRIRLAELTLTPQPAELKQARLAIDQVRRHGAALLAWEFAAE